MSADDLITSQMQNAQMAASAPQALNAAKKATPEQARAVGEKFEAQFLSQMLQQMFTGVDPKGGMFGGGHAEAMFRPMLMDEYAKLLVARGGLGVADQVAAQVMKSQEG